MNRWLERSALLSGVLILVASLQFGANLLGTNMLGGTLLGALPALLVALGLGVGATLLWVHFQLTERRAWLPPLILSLTVVGAVLVVQYGLQRSFSLWFSPALTLAGSGATMAVLLRSRARCNLCNRRLRSQSVVFRCPRCGMDVCDETCWNFEHRRCQLCLEQRVPILSESESWWTRVTGPRARHGRCLLCLGSPEQVDLRACPNCRRTQCRSCWDFNNAECSRCGRSLPELPASLTMAVAKIATPENSAP